MRKLATKLLVALGLLTSGGAWAQTSGLIGITKALDNDAKTIGVTETKTLDNLTVSVVNGTTVASNGSVKSFYVDGVQYTDVASSNNWKKTERTATYTANQYVGFNIKVANGYSLDLSQVYARLLTENTTLIWKVQIVEMGEGNIIFTSEEKTTEKNSNPTPYVSETLSLTDLTGEIEVRLYLYHNGGVKYFSMDKFTVQGVVNEKKQVQYFKPTITIGNYDVNTGTYPVTMETSDADGVISYKLGDGAYTEYSGAISVDPNTTITAKVTGKSFKDSEEASKTTGAMPTLATPTATVTGYNFAANTYNITLAGPAGATIKYSTDNWATSGVYSEAIAVVPGATLKAKAEQTNMTASAELSYAVAAAPVGGSDETPTTSGTYTNNVSYSMAAITIPGGCIAGQISSGNSSISGSIKTRTNAGLEAISGNGFYVNVNPGYIVTSIKIKGLSNNSAGATTCSGVYVDGNETSVLAAPVELPYASAKAVEAAEIAVSGIQAKERIEFAFGEGYQAQMIITVTYECAGDITLNNVESLKYGFATLSAPNNFTVNKGTAYKARVSGSSLVLTEIDGVIPAESGVVVVGEKGANVTVKYTAEEATANVAGNELKGTSVRTRTSDLKGAATYLMMLQKSTSAFVSYTGEYFPANKAYVLVGGGANAVKSLSIVFGDEASATGINSVNVKETKVAEGTKHIINGQIVIKTQNGYMNLMGVKVK